MKKLHICPFVSSRAVRNCFLPDTNDGITLSPDHLDTCNDGDDKAGDDDTEDTTNTEPDQDGCNAAVQTQTWWLR